MTYTRKLLLQACFATLLGSIASGALPDVEIRVSSVVASGFVTPLLVTHAGDGSNRLFVVEQIGRIWVIENDVKLPTPFLDIRTLVSTVGERGLLGLAFHPDYASNGFFFVHYSSKTGASVLARYAVSAGNPNVADAGSHVPVLVIAQPYTNHNGGHLAFRPTDGYLYAAIGDGGSGNDPHGHGQNKESLLGTMLRIDVDGGFPYAIPPDNPFVGTSGADEIWGYGLRNPWRFSFDRETGDLYIGDVGQGIWEEIDFEPATSTGGSNFGWALREGPCPLGARMPCAPAPLGLVDPIAFYPHGTGFSVTGGYVYRGERYPALTGRYFFGDFVTGLIFSVYPTGPDSWSELEVELAAGLNISSFGEDEQGELYVLDYAGGTLRRVEDAVDAPHFLSVALPTGYRQVPYDQTLDAAGGRAPYVFELVSGALPPGLSGPDASGRISGVPSEIGDFGPLSIRVTDQNGRFDESEFSIRIELGAPTPIAPSGALNDQTPTFSWTTSPTATSYELIVERVSDASSVLNEKGLEATTFTPADDLDSGESYRWRARATNGVDFSAFSPDLVFEIDTTAPRVAHLSVSPPPSYSSVPGDAIASSGDASPTYARTKATDGDPSTSWSTPGRAVRQDEFITVDLKSARSVSRVRLRSRFESGVTFPVDFQIQTSLNDVDYLTVQSVSGFDATANTEYAFPFTDVSARYVRVLVTNVKPYLGVAYFTQIGELGVDTASPSPNAMEIRWLAPGDDLDVGTASSYDLRWSLSEILDESFADAAAVPGIPTPQLAGSLETLVFSNLLPETRYFFALKTTDDAGNPSPISNVASQFTVGIPPAPIDDLRISNPTFSSLELEWTASGDDGKAGTAFSYEVRYASSPITEASFPSATEVTSGVPSPAVSGSPQHAVVTDLSSTTTYFFAMRVLDEVGNVSPISNVATGSTLDDTPPSKVTDLRGLSGAFVPMLAAVTASAASGEASASWSRGNAVDGKPETAWSTPGRPTMQQEFLIVDLGSAKTLNQLRLQARNVGALFPEDYRIQLSMDGQSFATVVGVTGTQVAPGAWVTHPFAPTRARFVKLLATKSRAYAPNGLYYVQLAEMEVYEVSASRGVVTLIWTAPGDDGVLEQASAYDLRHAFAPIENDEAFESATPVATPLPQAAGAQETVVVEGLEDEKRYYFALKTRDDVANVSDLSMPVMFVDTPGTPPAPLTGLAASNPTGTHVELSWTSSGDDGTTGQATSYDVRYSTMPITFATFDTAMPVPSASAPKPSGQPESLTVTGLENETRYYFAVKVLDELDNASGLSNVVDVTTLDVTEPSAVGDLTATAGGFVVEKVPVSAHSSSGDAAAGFSKDMAVDGNPLTSWSTPPRGSVQEEFLTLYAGVVLAAARVELCSRNLGDLFPESFLIEVSLDGTRFTTVHSEVGFVATPGTCYSFDFAPKHARYVRLRITKTRPYPPNAMYYAQVSEVSVFDATARPDRVTLAWTAPGDDAMFGTAARYDLRYATSLITAENFDDAMPVAGVPVPRPAATRESFVVTGLASDSRYWFALETADESGNVSMISNVVESSTFDVTPPARITDLSVDSGGATSRVPVVAVTSSGDASAAYGKNNAVDGNAATSWSTPGRALPQEESLTLDLGSARKPARVDLCARDVTGALFPEDFELELSLDTVTYASVLSRTGFVATAAACYRFELAAQTARYVRLRVSKARRYLVSNSFYVQLAEVEVFERPTPADELIVTFTAPGDDGFIGTAASYDLRYATSPIEEDDFDDATPVPTVSAPRLGGTFEAFVVQGLGPGTEYFFAVKARDSAGNPSQISNLASATTGIP